MKNDSNHGTYGSYMTGFVVSILLTLTAFDIVANHVGGALTGPIIIVLAVIQLIVQLTFFLHLSAHPKERWNLAALIFTGFMLLFIVIGSLWIMNHLNHNMSPDQVNSYMHKQN